MAYEVRKKDLLGRIGLLRTKSGTIETPLLLPVVNPNTQAIPAKDLRSVYGFDSLITNSYLVWRKFHGEKEIPKIHQFLNFDGVIETDSGAYQILQYGDVEVKPNEIVRFQEQLDSDIAVMLDVPTGESSKERAKWTVEETLRRADSTLETISERYSMGRTYPGRTIPRPSSILGKRNGETRFSNLCPRQPHSNHAAVSIRHPR